MVCLGPELLLLLGSLLPESTTVGRAALLCTPVVGTAHALETDRGHQLDELGFLLLENRANSTNLAGLLQEAHGFL